MRTDLMQSRKLNNINAHAELLGVTIQKKLKQEQHLNIVAKSCHGTLLTLQKVENFRDCHPCKRLATDNLV